MTEKLCLKWNEFQENTTTLFGRLRNDSDFTDVTLVCEDGEQVEAHKVILAASSPFFQNLLRRNKHPHPLIYMRGVKSEDLVAIVDFLYYGEANVYQESIDTFLALAEEFKLKGLTGNKDNESIEETAYKTKPKAKQYKQQEARQDQRNILHQTGSVKKETDVFEGTIANITIPGEITYLQDLDEKVKSLMEKSQNMTKIGTKRADICTVCRKEGDTRQIKDHIEANHLEGVSIPCSLCEKTFRTRSASRRHVRGKQT